jgi:hypothetical protein
MSTTTTWEPYTEKFLDWLLQSSPDDFQRIMNKNLTNKRLKRLMVRFETEYPEAYKDKPNRSDETKQKQTTT